jgi:carboxylate-amine ligase
MKASDVTEGRIRNAITDEKPSFTLGIEEEYMILDPQTFDLRSHVSLELLTKGKLILHEQMQDHIKPEMHGAMLEMGTGICKNTKEALAEVAKYRSIVRHLAQKNGLEFGAASTHPFANWETQEIYPDPRYQTLIQDMQVLARSLLIFGMHIHIGIENREIQIQIMNVIRYFLPHILAISTNSPFWVGDNTGLKSYRSKVFERFPRTNLPDTFNTWGEYDEYCNLLIKTGCIDNPKKIWWDIRPHPFFPTLEVRICDLPMRVDETVAIAALCQALAAKLYSLYEKNLSFRTYRRSLMMENKWRAVRYGLDGKLIDFGKQKELPARELIRELLEFVDDQVDELGSRDEINVIHNILENGSGADRQIRIYNETGDVREVAKYISAQTQIGLLDDVTPYLAQVHEPTEEQIREKMTSLTPPKIP